MLIESSENKTQAFSNWLEKDEKLRRRSRKNCKASDLKNVSIK